MAFISDLNLPEIRKRILEERQLTFEAAFKLAVIQHEGQREVHKYKQASLHGISNNADTSLASMANEESYNSSNTFGNNSEEVVLSVHLLVYATNVDQRNVMTRENVEHACLDGVDVEKWDIGI